MRSFALAAVAVCLVLPSTVAAQEEDPRPEKHENVTWYAVVNLDFVSGKRDAAMNVIREHFAPAAREAGTPGPVMQLEHQSGEWDLTLIWHMDRGPGGMEWKTTPEGIAWQKAFEQRVGGEEKAREITETFD
ncbi:MAG: hypothetical protein ACOC83_09075, partial [Gemmatimonadota bacterium]